MLSASYEYKNQSPSNGAKYYPIGMSIVYWITGSLNSSNELHELKMEVELLFFYLHIIMLINKMQ